VSAATVAELIGIFLAGATPGLEAVIVVPVGIAAGLPVPAVLAAAIAGNLATVVLSVVFGERVRRWWRRRRANQDRTDRRSQRAQRVADRWGLPGLALLGPVSLGTQASAVIAIALGQTRQRTLTWISAGTVVWAAVAASLAAGGLQLLGIGA